MNEKKVAGSAPDAKRKAEKEVEKMTVSEKTESHRKVKQLKGTAKWRAGQLEDKGKAQASQNGAKVTDVKNDFWHNVRPTAE